MDAKIADVAARQRGLITTAQLAALAVDRSAIARRVDHGRLHRLHAGVYVVGTRTLMPLARELAAVLAAGEGAVLSHWSAAYVWEMVGRREGDVHVTIPTDSGRKRPGIRIHRPKITASEITTHMGIPITTPLRTIDDLAKTEPTTRLERAVNEARARGLTTTKELHALADRRSKKLRAILNEAPGFTRSEAERRLRQLLRKAGLPQPITNALVEGKERDAVWREQRLVVEFDSWRHHGHRQAFERDRKRDQELIAAGWRTIRITWRQLTSEPETVIATLARALYAPYTARE